MRRWVYCSFFLITVLIVSAGCSAAQAPAATAVPPLTATSVPPAPPPLPPTATPVPPTAAPTATPLPTKTPTPAALEPAKFVGGKMVLADAAFYNLMDILTGDQFSENYREQIAVLQAMQEYALTPRQTGWVYSFLAICYQYLGHPQLAVDHYQKALDQGLQQPFILNGICGNYVRMNRPDQALAYCNDAVELERSGASLDNRGMMYALLGKYPEAVSDFEAAVDMNEYNHGEVQAKRLDWIKVLKTGKNPINTTELKNEGYEEQSIETDPLYTGNLTVDYLRTTLESEEYQFTTINLDGKPGVKGLRVDGNCRAEAVLMGEKDLQSATLTTSGCDDKNSSGVVLGFYGPFVKDAKEFGQAYVWLSADVYYVIEGKPVTDLSLVFGGHQMKVERIKVQGKDGLKVSAVPAK